MGTGRPWVTVMVGGACGLKTTDASETLGVLVLLAEPRLAQPKNEKLESTFLSSLQDPRWVAKEPHLQFRKGLDSDLQFHH